MAVKRLLLHSKSMVDPEVDIVPREEWGARPPGAPGEVLGENIVAVVATLHTDTPACASADDCERTVREIQHRHMQAGRPDIQYNFLIGCDGRIYEGRGWYKKSCPFLATPENFPEGEERLDIAFIGDWRFVENPSIEMLDPAMYFVIFGIKNKFISKKFKFLELDKRYQASNQPDPLENLGI